MVIVIAAMMAMSVGWLSLFFFQGLEQAGWQEKWFRSSSPKIKEPIFFRWNRPLVRLTRPLLKNEFWSLSLWLGLEMAVLMSFYFGWNPWAFFFGFGLGFATPWFLNRWQKRQRLESIRLGLPFVMDLLAVSVQAGMDWIQAIQKIVGNLPQSPLLLELKGFLDDLKLGKTRRDALVALKTRVALAEIHQFVSLLLQALKLGSPLAPILQALASQMRDRRMFLAERLGVQASLKILFPLVFCILPAVFLTLFAPLALRYFFSGGSLFSL